MKFTMTKIAAAAALALASSAAMAAPVATTGVFDMFSTFAYDQSAGNQNMGTNGTVGHDTSVTGFIDTAAGTWGVSSTAVFFGQNWTASNGTLVQAAGDYMLNTATGVVSLAAPDTAGTKDGLMHFTVGAGQMAGIIDFSWGGNNGIKVIDVWNVSTSGSNTVYTGFAVPGMENGPFQGYNARFNLTAPVPEASTYGMMLAGLGLVGFAVRRRKLMA